MTKHSDDDRARNFMRFGFQVSEATPEISAEVEAWEHKYARYEIIKAIYIDTIMEAMKSYTDDLVFTFNPPKAEHRSCSVLEAEICDELEELSESTLDILVAVLTTKTRSN